MSTRKTEPLMHMPSRDGQRKTPAPAPVANIEVLPRRSLRVATPRVIATPRPKFVGQRKSEQFARGIARAEFSARRGSRW